MTNKLELTPELMLNIIESRGEMIEQYRVEVERLKRYEALVTFIANDYVELSHDKIKWQYFEYKKRCAKLIEEDHP
jgi:hypothetical protein